MFSSYERCFRLRPWELDWHSAEHGLISHFRNSPSDFVGGDLAQRYDDLTVVANDARPRTLPKLPNSYGGELHEIKTT